MNHDNRNAERQISISIFLIGLTCLMYELIQVRMLSFFLGGISNFLAIPLALFGLALGSLYCHFIYKGDRQALITRFSAAVFPLLAAVFLVFFWIANTFFYDIHVALQNPWRDSAKLITYSIIFLPPYFVFGALLASFFEEGADRIGRLYFFDLLGAGLGCLLTPLLFTYTDLAPTILTLLFAALLLLLNVDIKRKVAVVATMVLIYGALHALSANGTVFKEHPSAVRLARTLLKAHPKQGAKEEVIRWNALARTSLLRVRINNDHAQRSRFTITQDDGISNVHVLRYDTRVSKEAGMKVLNQHTYPFVMGLKPKNILVMFAGVGRDMVLLDQLCERTAKITGVELNDAVANLAYNPVLFPMNLHNFFKLDRIRMITKEGRDFLNTSKDKYDLIYLATNGSIHATRTGHSRKYLDTYEAMGAYLNHLTGDGLMLFATQPVQWKIQAFKKLFAERNMPDFERSLMVMGHRTRIETDTMLLKPSGLSRQDVDNVEAMAKERDPHMKRLYTPYSSRGVKRIINAVKAPLDRLDIITDDRPFIRKVQYKDFTLLPSQAQLKNQIYASSWIKIFTIFLFGIISLLVIAASRFIGGEASRVPWPWLLYFIVSGISYMCVEIGLIAKTELFLGNPLYAVAIILAFFLAFNGLGAFMQDKYKVMRGTKTLLVITSAAILWSVLAVQLCNSYLLSIGIVFKIIAVALAVFPVGTALGMYYPFGVASLTAENKRSTIPMTYSLATLSSVLGSSFAMTGITNIGFSTMIIIGGTGYAAVALIYLAMNTRQKT